MKTQLYLFVCISILNTSFLFAQSDKIYGLNFTPGQVDFASMDINTGAVDVLNSTSLLGEGFTQGVADFDPISKTYYFIKQERLYSIDATTGNLLNNPLIANPSNAIEPITNIAFNWLNDTIYGLNHVYINDLTQLRLSSVDPTSGALNIISQNPVGLDSYLSGNSDIDPIHRRYFYASNEKVYTVDLDSGENIYESEIIFPFEGIQFMANLTYNWLDGLLYCLHFKSIPNPDPFSEEYTSELRLSTLDPATGMVTLISSTPTSPDGFSMGDCDIDPVNNRYFYLRQNVLYIVDLNTGEVINEIEVETANNAIAPIINMSYDDLALEPIQPLVMDMGETIVIDAGSNIKLDAYVGSEVSYLWQDGSTNASITVQESGYYEVNIIRNGFTIQGGVDVLVATPTAIQNLDSRLNVQIFPIPANDYLTYTIEGINQLKGSIIIQNSVGQLYKTFPLRNKNGTIDLSNFSSGIYFITFKSDNSFYQEKIIVW